MKYKAQRTNVNSNLQESIQMNEKYLGRSAKDVTKKWNKELGVISEALGGKVDDYKLLTTAVLLENTANHLNQYRSLTEATQPSNVSFFKRYALNLLSAVVPNLIAEDEETCPL